MEHAAEAIAVTLAESRLGAEFKALDTGDKIRTAWRLIRDDENVGFMIANDDQRFRATVAIVLRAVDEDERERMQAELTIMQGIVAATRGLPIDMAALLAGAPENPIGINGIFRELIAERRGG